MTTRTKYASRLILTTAMLLGLTACDGMDDLKNATIIKDTKAANDTRIASIVNNKSATTDPLTVSDDVWVGNQSVRMRRGQPLPGKFDRDNGFALVSSSPLSLAEIATQMANTTGIPVRMGDMELPSAGGATTASTTTESAGMSISYEGPFSTFLDQVASQFDIAWRYDGQSIYLYRFENRTFNVEAMPGKTSVDDSFDTGSSSGGGGGGGGSGEDIKQKNQIQADMDYWKELEASIKGILGGDGVATVMPTSGNITVTARPAKLGQVARFLDTENRNLSRQVAIDVVVYSVTMRDTNSYGMNLTSAFRGSWVGDGLSSVTLTGPASLSDPSSVTQGSLTVSLLGAGWGLNNMVPKALSTLGNVAVVTRSPIITLNNRPTSRKITVDRAYLASVSTTVSGTSGTPTTSLTPGTVTTGFALQLLPRMLADGRMLLQYSIRISDLVGDIRTFTSGTGASQQTIQTPEVDNKVFIQQAVMQNGSTLVLAGFEKNKNTDSSQGIGSATNWLLGGGVSNDSNREQLVITITPREITPDRGSSTP